MVLRCFLFSVGHGGNSRLYTTHSRITRPSRMPSLPSIALVSSPTIHAFSISVPLRLTCSCFWDPPPPASRGRSDATPARMALAGSGPSLRNRGHDFGGMVISPRSKDRCGLAGIYPMSVLWLGMGSWTAQLVSFSLSTIVRTDWALMGIRGCEGYVSGRLLLASFLPFFLYVLTSIPQHSTSLTRSQSNSSPSSSSSSPSSKTHTHALDKPPL